MSFSVNQLAYLQRNVGVTPPLSDSREVTPAPVALRRLWRINGVGLLDKQVKRDPHSDAAVHMPTLDFLVGLYGFRIPIAFHVHSVADRLSVEIGTFLGEGQIPEQQAARILSERQQVLRAGLNATARSLDIRPADPAMDAPRSAGLVIGIPTIKAPDPADGALPLDRLVRALKGTSWGCLVLAQPLDPAETTDLRMRALEDLKPLQLYLQNLKYPDPLAQHFATLLDTTVGDYTYGLAIGAWRTNVYLTGDESGYMRLGSVWQGVFSGDRSLHMPISVMRQPEAPAFVAGWRVSDAVGPAGPAKFHHRYAHQTILTSDQLAAYVHLPQIETNGFSIVLNPSFDTVPSDLPEGAKAIQLGRVVEGTRETQTEYAVSLQGLNKHTLIAGVTGSGKTNTLLGLLSAADRAGIPFLVVEPAKTEYRALLKHPDLGSRIQVFTLGNENVSPFRLNPFESLPGTPIAAHIDMLRSAFGAGFGMWTPLPQVLEQCLHEIYADRGWDLSADHNVRARDRSEPLAFPTLTDLLHKVDDVTPRLGYDEKIASDIRAALRTRINSLRAGGKGRMLDTRESIPADALFGHPVVLELEQMGDEDDKAFIMGLILIRVWEYRRMKGRSDALRHLLVVEEAHRLLSNVSQRSSQEESNARGKAVESFTNMLAEVRAYGQGMIIADQSPIRLAPDVIKNTDLKIAHRIVAHEDRTTLMGAMAMNESQSKALATLPPGTAVVFREGEDGPLLIKVTEAKRALGATWPSDQEVAERRARAEGIGDLAASHPGCGASRESLSSCELSRTVAESAECQRNFTRIVLSAFEPTEVLSQLWQAMQSQIQAVRRGDVNVSVLTQCTVARAAWAYADRRGAAASWSFRDTERFARGLIQVVTGLSEDRSDRLPAFQALLIELSQRDFSPYSHCDLICSDEPPTCLYRYDAALLIRDPSLRRAWEDADVQDLQKGGRLHSLSALQDAAELIVYRNEESLSKDFQRTALCCAQQLLADDPRRLQESRERAIGNILVEAMSTVDQAPEIT